VAKSTTVLSTALKKLQDKASAAEGSLETVVKLTQQQQTVLDSAKGQLSALEQLGATLSRFDDGLAATLASVREGNGLTSELAVRIAGIVADGAEIRRTLETALSGVSDALKAQLQSTNSVVTTLEAGATATRAAAQSLADKLDASASATIAVATDTSKTVAAKLDVVAAADIEIAQALGALGQQATEVLGRVDDAVKELQGMVRQLVALDGAFRPHGNDSRYPVDRVDMVGGAAVVPDGAAGPTFRPGPGQPPLSSTSDAPLQGPRWPASHGEGGLPMSSAGSNFDGNLVAGAGPSTVGQTPGVSRPPTSGPGSPRSGPAGEVAQTFPAEPPAS
jgi:hypothetical protein